MIQSMLRGGDGDRDRDGDKGGCHARMQALAGLCVHRAHDRRLCSQLGVAVAIVCAGVPIAGVAVLSDGISVEARAHCQGR